MALDTYTDLKNAVINWPDLSGEGDIEAAADDLITLGEARIYRTLRLRRMITTLSVADLDPAVSSYTLPSDFLEVERVKGPSAESLEYRPANELDTWGWEPDDPALYSIEGSDLLFAPVVTGFELRYYALPLPLVTTNTNWLLTKAPGLYLYSALIDAAIFSKETDQEAGRYRDAYGSAAGELMEEEENSQFPRGQPLRSAVGNVGRKPRNR